MADIIGDNAFFATVYITDIPVFSVSKDDNRQRNRDLADSVSKLFYKSKSKRIYNYGVERVVLPGVIQKYDNSLESTTTPKIYTCGGRVYIVVDEKLNSQKSLSTRNIEDLAKLMKDSSEKRQEICNSIYGVLLDAGSVKDPFHKNYFCDINALELRSGKEGIIDNIVPINSNHCQTETRDEQIAELDDAYSILFSTGADNVQELSAIYNHGVRIPLRCSNTVTGPDRRVITVLTVPYGASVAVKDLEKEYLTQVS